MALNATMRVAEIESLASTIDAQRNTLDGQLHALIAQAQRGDAFTGNAAESYDMWLNKWQAGQTQMLEAMHEAAALLHKYAAALDELEGQVSAGFNV